jgi:hypothetical protein
MTNCATCGRPHVTLGLNAVYLNPANWNDKRLECDDCAGVERDEQGRVVYKSDVRETAKVRM